MLWLVILSANQEREFNYRFGLPGSYTSLVGTSLAQFGIDYLVVENNEANSEAATEEAGETKRDERREEASSKWTKKRAHLACQIAATRVRGN